MKYYTVYNELGGKIGLGVMPREDAINSFNNQLEKAINGGWMLKYKFDSKIQPYAVLENNDHMVLHLAVEELLDKETYPTHLFTEISIDSDDESRYDVIVTGKINPCEDVDYPMALSHFFREISLAVSVGNDIESMSPDNTKEKWVRIGDNFWIEIRRHGTY
ncbi:MAG TPA: hypothetical protein VEW28_01545 [Candidatus Kapabacteria bacterium]|nr:hypothetical protein [Candidatus Kapabacteria bacterium]